MSVASKTMSSPTSLSPALPKPEPQTQFLIRPLRPSDIPSLASLAQKAWDASPLTPYLHPYLHDSPAIEACNLRWIGYKIRRRMLDPKYESYVAVVVKNEDDGKGETEEEVVGLTQFYRSGDAKLKDGGVRRQIEKREPSWSAWGMYLKCRRWMWMTWMKVEGKLWPDLSLDQEHVKEFAKVVEADDKQYWEAEARFKERWHVQSVFVGVEWQRRGVGMLLMQEVLERAREEGVCVGIEASKEGEGLYRKCGFRVLERFGFVFPGCEVDDGGIMVWEPIVEGGGEEQEVAEE